MFGYVCTLSKDTESWVPLKIINVQNCQCNDGGCLLTWLDQHGNSSCNHNLVGGLGMNRGTSHYILVPIRISQDSFKDLDVINSVVEVRGIGFSVNPHLISILWGFAFLPSKFNAFIKKITKTKFKL